MMASFMRTVAVLVQPRSSTVTASPALLVPMTAWPMCSR